jgi:hypothetical protein
MGINAFAEDEAFRKGETAERVPLKKRKWAPV